jgi:hypothetical protein
MYKNGIAKSEIPVADHARSTVEVCPIIQSKLASRFNLRFCDLSCSLVAIAYPRLSSLPSVLKTIFSHANRVESSPTLVINNILSSPNRVESSPSRVLSSLVESDSIQLVSTRFPNSAIRNREQERLTPHNPKIYKPV